MNEPLLPPASVPPPLLAPRTSKQQSWGTVISIAVIVLMIVVGAFYAWGKRIAEERALIEMSNLHMY